MTILVRAAFHEQRMVDLPYRRLKVVEACGLLERMFVKVCAFVDFDGGNLYFATIYKDIPRDLLLRCQLPDIIPVGTHGNTIHRSSAWAKGTSPEC